MNGTGYRTGLIKDTNRTNWQNSSPRPIAWSAWYPADGNATQPLPPDPLFDAGEIRPGAKIASGGPYPVVLLSHGTGGTAESLGWLASVSLAAALLTGEADREAPTGACARWLTAQNGAFRHHSLGAEVGHYTFLDKPADPDAQAGNPVFTDAPSVSRAEVHAATADLVAGILA